jgi:hypothetical protein
MKPTAILLIIASALSAAAHAGPITPPPGPVASTHKTLSEVEPRIAINATNTPGDGDSLFKITLPGSYYLTGNITGVAGKHGIEIAASNVTIDLHGFALIGSGGVGIGDGITTESARSQITIRNGTIQRWDSDGINLNTGGVGTGFIIENITIANCNATGIVVGELAVIRACTSRGNTGSGFSVGDHGIIEMCSAVNNDAIGFFVGDAVRITACTASANALIGFLGGAGVSLESSTADTSGGRGFGLGDNAAISRCTARDNAGNGFNLGDRATVTDSSASSNTQSGFSLGTGGTIRGCTSQENEANGISVGAASVVVDSTARANVTTGIGGNNGVTVSRCTASANGRHGIDMGNDTVITDCTASGNTQNGIHVGYRALVARNNSSGNGVGAGVGAGIYVLYNDGRVENNLCASNDYGIHVDGVGNLIVSNMCTRNTVNFDFYNFNQWGRIVDLTTSITGTVSGNSAASSLGSSDPWANFAVNP